MSAAAPSAPQTPAKDDFAARARAAVAEKPAPSSAPSVPKLPKPNDSFAVLHAALEHGTYFVDDDAEPKGDLLPIDPDFAAAIEVARALLEDVEGVLRVGAGRDEAQAPVILVVTAQGFGEASMKKVPEKVKGFSTLITVPYTLLPLRRER